AAKGLKAIREILSDGEPLTRGEIVERLAAQGVVLDRRTQAPIHLIGLAALEGIVCLATDTPTGETTYPLAEKWIRQGKTLARDEALAELARRYLKGYAPASTRDFAGWSGLALTDAKRAWEGLKGELVEAEVEGNLLWMPEAAKKPGKTEMSVRLLPAFDAYLLGYADRALLVAKQHQSEVYHGGQTVPVVLVDGLAAGTWRYKRQGKRLEITVHPFEEFDGSVRELIAEEADDIGRFWGVKASLAYSEKPV
ncbi:MAG: winged helix DNA-binding domain-containing protein, partial [Chloroflexota bacterium]